MKTSIFYFTGTGNSCAAAEQIQNNLEDCTLYNLADFDWNTPIISDQIGLVYPVYFWGIPNMVRKFIENAIFPKDCTFFAVATCGGAPGDALAIPNALLMARGLSLQAGYTVKMPDNYIVSLKAPAPEQQKEILLKAQDELDTISKNIRINHTTKTKPINPLFSTFHNSFRKSFATRDNNFIVNNHCISCGKCASVCPAQNITLEQGKPVWHHQCEFCLGCLNICPKKAINYGKKTIKKRRYTYPGIQMVSILLVMGMLFTMGACQNQPAKTETSPSIGDSVVTQADVQGIGTVEISFPFEKQDGYATNQFAVWIEDEDGKMIKTLFATKFTANGGYKKREDAIPTWVERSGLKIESGSKPEAVAGATPDTGEQKFIWDCTNQEGEPVPAGSYHFCVEGTIFWEDRVLYSGTIQIGKEPVSTEATAEFSTDTAKDKTMIGSVTASYLPK